MADLSTVEKALVGKVAAVLWPSTAYSAGAKVASTLAGLTVKVFRGWPIADDLDADMIAGRAQVSIYADSGLARNTSRYLDGWREGAAVTPTLTAVASGQTVTFGGTGAAGQVAGVTVGDGPSPAAYAYRIASTQAPSLVAGAFAAMIDGASAAGAVLTVPGTAGARVVADSPALRVLRMQEQGFRVSLWCPSPAARDALAALLDAGLTDLRRFTLGDGSTCRFLYRGTYVFDPPQKARIWRRDLTFTAEYATTQVEAQPGMLFGTLGAGIGFGVSRVPVVADALMTAGPTSPQLILYTDEDGTPLMDAGGNLLGPVPE